LSLLVLDGFERRPPELLYIELITDPVLMVARLRKMIRRRFVDDMPLHDERAVRDVRP